MSTPRDLGPSMMESMPGDMSDPDVVKWVQKAAASDKITKNSFTGIALKAEELLYMMPVAKHLIDGTPQKIQVGGLAPDGPVFTPDGAPGTLHEKIRACGQAGQPRPLTLLNFGSFTWPPYTYKLPILAEMTSKFVESGTLAVLDIYIREAHPTDGWSLRDGDPLYRWSLETNDKAEICIAQTKTLTERLEAAKNFQAWPLFKGTPAERIPLFVDDPRTRALDHAYEAVPERVVLLDSQFKVLFASGQGPFQYDLKGAIKAVEASAAAAAPAVAQSAAL